MLARKQSLMMFLGAAILGCCGIGVWAHTPWTQAHGDSRLALHAPVPPKRRAQSAQAMKSDEDRLQGTWKLEKRMWAGKDLPGLDLQWTFRKDQLEHQTGAFSWEAKFKVDSSGDLKKLDVFQDGQVMRCLFRFEGGKLIVAKRNGYFFEGERPEKIVSMKGDNSVIVSTFAAVTVASEKHDIDEEATQKAKMKMARARCNANLHRLVRAMHRYLDIHGHFPPAFTSDGAGKPLLSWRVAVLPYLGEEELYKHFRQDEPWNSDHNRKLLAKMPKIFASVDLPPKNKADTFYQVFSGEDGIFEPGKRIGIGDIPDGTVNTVAVIAAGKSVPWAKPADIVYDATTPLPSLTGGMINDGYFSFATADAGFHMAINTIDPDALRPFILRNTGDLKDFKTLTNNR